MKVLSLLTFIALVFSLAKEATPLNARPISYPDSWTLMQQYNWERLNIHYHYTPNINNSVGFVFSDYEEVSQKLYAAQWNHLIYRENKKKSQANLYSKLQLGTLRVDDKDEDFYHFDLHLSYAGKPKHFCALSIGTTYDGPEESFSAPIGTYRNRSYLAGYGQLHTWLMLQVEHHRDETLSDNRLLWTPMLRLFKATSS